MTPDEFVKNFYIERQRLVDLYFDGKGQTDVSEMIQGLNLDEKNLATMKEILMATLRDAFYVTLLELTEKDKLGTDKKLIH